MTIDDKNYSLKSYKEFFVLSRNFLSKQIILSKKINEISHTKDNVKADVIACLSLLNLDEIIDNINKIYELEDQIKINQKYQKEIIKNNKNILINKKIQAELFLIEKNEERLEKFLSVLYEKIKTLDISGFNNDIIKEAQDLDEELKDIFKNIHFKNKEIKNINKFIEESNKSDFKSSQIFKLFQQAEQEIPELIKMRFKEVETFHQAVYSERKEMLSEKISQLTKEVLEDEQTSQTINKKT